MQGQTDLNPTSAIGKLSQVVFAVISPGRVVANIVAGAIAEAGAQQAGDMMQVVAAHRRSWHKLVAMRSVCPRSH